VKVHFQLEVDDDGWPPVSLESLWAVDLGDGTARLDNTPWFVRGVARGDVVRVDLDDDGLRWATETVAASGNCAIRLIVQDDSGSITARRGVLADFQQLGADGEGIEQYGMVALDVPPGADLPAIWKLLRQGAADGRWDWEEGCTTAAWWTVAETADHALDD
jgi:hypothetical protein